MDDYSTEPRLVFTKLQPQRYAELYQLEMGSFNEDLPFYTDYLHPKMDLLELGCGTGRLTQHLALHVHSVCAVDINPAMLNHCPTLSNVHCIQDDMATIKLGKRFHCIIIPYNTLNLLSSVNIIKTLKNCHAHLKESGLLLMQIYIPSAAMVENEEEIFFQFDRMENPSGGKVIKEVLRKYEQENIFLTERYRIRPMQQDKKNEDLIHEMTLRGYSAEKWHELFTSTGFTVSGTFSSPSRTPFDSTLHTSLFVCLSR